MAVIDLMHLHIVSLTESRNALLTNWLQERAGDMTSMAGLPILGEIIRHEAQSDGARVDVVGRLLDGMQSPGEPYESIVVYDAGWTPVAETGKPTHAGQDIVTQGFREGVEHTSSVYFDEAHLHHGEDVGAHIGCPIRDEMGDVVGYLVANLNLTVSLTPLLQSPVGLWKTGKSYLISPDLRIITEPFGEGPSVRFRATANPILKEGQGEGRHAVHTYQDYLGHRVVGAAMPVPLHDWMLVVEVDMSEATAWVSVLLFRASIMVLAVLIAVLFVSLWLSDLLGRPLSRLAHVAQRISEGHIEERLDAMNVQEAEDVRLAFNHMMDELREKEQTLVRTATLATVGELTSSIVHEMRNPLSSVKMNLQALMRTSEESSDDRELAEIATEQVQRLETMLNELLQYGRPIVPNLSPARFSDLIAVVTESLEEKARTRRVNIAVEDHLGSAGLVVDKELFVRALVNLAGNAIDASPEGGEVRIVGERSQEGSNLEISVHDSGPGIREEQKARLFRPFFTTKPGGIGLGLANVKKTAALHGGDVLVENAAAGGAVFRLVLPVRGGG
jgi:signal transduction histidine kinase